jgi:hypothetical protein
MGRYEVRALRRASLVIALTEHDRTVLHELSGFRDDRIRPVTAPFPTGLPAGTNGLTGDPAVTLMDGPWWPTRDATDWFVSKIWPEIRRVSPEAVLHCFGYRALPDRPGMEYHPAPAESSEIFSANTILAVPLRIASGVRMKILESWSRGIPVVASPEAARGLDSQHGRNLLIADSPWQFAESIKRLRTDNGLREQLITGGRSTLAEHHDPAEVGELLVTAYRDAMQHGHKRE